MPATSLTITAMPNRRNVERVFRRAVYGIAREAVERTRPLQVHLVAPPPRKEYPYGEYPWVSEAQRIAAIIAMKKRGGPPHVRTGKLVASWVYEVVQGPDGVVQILLRNTSKIAKYVIGGVRSYSPQQPFHYAAGWRRMKDIRAELFEAVRIEMNALYIETLAGLGKVQVGR